MAYKRSSARNLRKSWTTTEELRQTVDKDYNGTTRGSIADTFQREAAKTNSFQWKQERRVNYLVKDWSIGGHGWVPTKKPDGTVCLVFENWNSLKFRTEKNRSIHDTRNKLNADILSGVESQVDWTQADGDKQFHDILGVGEDWRSLAACNTTEPIAQAQPGGTGMMTFGTFSQHICPVGCDDSCKDSTGLG